ncbi:MAG: DNA primase [Candidatus Aureabacteria bacterium]|nr:DNA primase [Candidatus Auribacterota bacterium]
MIPQNIVEQIQSANDIAEIVSSYIPLKRAGRSFKACCPFHNEKTPSFFVSPEKGIWHCFGCGDGGSVFNFVMRYERVTFPEAVRLLAKKAGVAIPEYSTADEREGEKREELYRINEFAAKWFSQQLATPVGKRVHAYLRKRGITDALIGQFSLGYAPDSWEGLYRAARKKGYRRESLLALGLVMQKERGDGLYDRFRNRLMIPICDVSGRVIAFSGRVLGEGNPKYMNSPESPLFSKSKSLYGLHLSKRSIVDTGTAVVVEGYFDYLTLYSAGITNVVASQGTAFTPDHARILRRYTREGSHEVVMSFDADAAGENAALRSVDAFLQEGLRVRVLMLPGGHDPDTFVREKGDGAFRKLMGEAPEYFDFLLERLCRNHGVTGEVGKARIASEFLDALAQVKDEVFREAYRKKLSERIDIAQEYIIREINKRTRSASAPSPDRAERGSTPQQPLRLPPGEREIVRLMVEDETIIRQVASELTPEDFRDSHLQTIARRAFDLLEREQWAGSSRLLACLADDRCTAVLSMLITEEQPSGDSGQVVRDCIRYLKRRNLKEELGRITKEISRRERGGAPNAEIVELQRLLMKQKTELLKVS